MTLQKNVMAFVDCNMGELEQRRDSLLEEARNIEVVLAKTESQKEAELLSENLNSIHNELRRIDDSEKKHPSDWEGEVIKACQDSEERKNQRSAKLRHLQREWYWLEDAKKSALNRNFQASVQVLEIRQEEVYKILKEYDREPSLDDIPF
jgi:hypothetical protein